MNIKEKIEEILNIYVEEYDLRMIRIIGEEQVAKDLVEELLTLYEQAQRDAVGGLKVRQISGFQRDELGRWYKRYPTGMVLVTDELLLDALNVRQENIDLINDYLNQTKEDSEIH